MKSVHSERYKKFLAALIAARKSADITQAELARKLGKPQSFVSKFENGERRLDVIEFLDVCTALGADAQNLLSAAN